MSATATPGSASEQPQHAGRAGDAAAYRSRADNMQRLLAKK